MRIWSLHPRYLDTKGLVALWREGLLAQAVIAGQTRGYRHHPQLARFRESPDPDGDIVAYLRSAWSEAERRGYRFDASKIGRAGPGSPLTVTEGQLRHEWEHLTNKLLLRAPAWLAQFSAIELPDPHPLFRVIAGDVAVWEVAMASRSK